MRKMVPMDGNAADYYKHPEPSPGLAARAGNADGRFSFSKPYK